MSRKEISKSRLTALLDAAPEMRHQCLDAWLQIATRTEIRRAWVKVNRLFSGKMPMPHWAA